MSNMYSKAVATWSPFVGCRFNCTYCTKSFQAQAKRLLHRCVKCYNYEPHFHPERLKRALPKTGPGEFIFCCASGDIAFSTAREREMLRNRIRQLPDRTFLVQTKAPHVVWGEIWPANVILGTTIETDNERLVAEVSEAPKINERLNGLIWAMTIRRMLTIEPVLDFEVKRLLFLSSGLHWIVKPEMVWIGYNSKEVMPNEPPVEKVYELKAALEAKGIQVMLKTMREQ